MLLFHSIAGGWMLIGNITTTSQEQASSRTYLNARTFDLTDLGRLREGDTILDGSLFQDLMQQQQAGQFRIFCTKPYHGRRFHVMSKRNEGGFQFRDYLLGKDVTWLHGPISCTEALQSLPDDNSYLWQACEANSPYIRSRAVGNVEARLYDHVLFEHGNLHVQLFGNQRLECDDFQPKHASRGYNQIGQWLYYVR